MIWNDSMLWQIHPLYREQAIEVITSLAAEGGEPPARPPRSYFDRDASTWDDLPVEIRDRIAIVRISGPLVQRSWWRTSYETLTITFNRLREARDIEAVVLQIDSPGGMCIGLADCAKVLNDLSEEKLTIAQVDGGCYSAAYYLACYCGEIACRATDHVGNIGTVTNIWDLSKWFQELGIRSVTKKTGPIKGLGIPGDPLTSEQEAFLEHMTLQHFGYFREAVMTGRGMTAEQFTDVSDGRWWLGAEAIHNGIIDRIATLDETIAAIRNEL